MSRTPLGVGLLVAALTGRADQFVVVAELGRVGPPAGEIVRKLAPGGPVWVLSVSRTHVNAWPAGRVSEPVVSVLPSTGPYGGPFAFGDFDGDGRLDLAVATPGGIALLRGDGSGRFALAANLEVEALSSFVAADVDGDGRDDLVIVPPGQASGSMVSVRLSRGDFSFEPERTTVITDAYLGVEAVTAADVDGDGIVDLVVRPGKGGPRIWKGSGDGTFTLTPEILTGYAISTPLVADLDGDGLAEVIYGIEYSPYVYPLALEIQHNDGGGKFHVWTPEPQMTRQVQGPFLGDFDGDGRTDVGFVDQDQTTGEWYLYSYRFAGASLVETRTAVPPSSVVAGVGDWDGDGKADLFIYAGTGVAVLGRAGARTDVAVVPVLLSTTGLFGSRFESDLLLTNSGSTLAHVTLRYAASAGGGSGVVERDLLPGRQLYAPSAVAFLRNAGLSIPSAGNVVGTLRIEATRASSPRAVSAAVRTTTPSGAGVAYGASSSVGLLREPAILPWLVESATDRTNLALVNAGASSDGPVTLRVEVHAGDGSGTTVTLPDVELAPGEFRQIGRVLAASGLAASIGWARITPAAGNAPFLAWAAVNDAGSGDGSFVAAQAESLAATYPYTWIVPNVVQTGRYTTEFVATNPGSRPLTLRINLAATWTFLTETIPPGATLHFDDLLGEMRARDLPGAPAAGVDVLSSLYVTASDGISPVFAGVRIKSSPESGRAYGVFESAVRQDDLRAMSMIVPSLRQDDRVRTNLGIQNPVQNSSRRFRVEIFDGDTGRLAGSTEVWVGANEVRQINQVLSVLAPGTSRAFARVIPPDGPLPFAAYAVINDGATPGAGTDDGSFMPGIPE
jgi:hypothetical protein